MLRVHDQPDNKYMRKPFPSIEIYGKMAKQAKGAGENSPVRKLERFLFWGTVRRKKMDSSISYVWRARKRNALGLPWTFTTYTLSEDRLFIKSGLLKTVEDEVRLYRILDLTMSKTLLQKIFKMGTITVSSADKTMSEFEIKNIKDVDAVKERLSALVEENREKKRVSNREFMTENDIADLV